ncbi:MAG TPA: hypothetical protein VMY59_04835 [Candidatus Thermoplasmatota archaeon]|nr:hypothetical protein [Candidatus Thermoplasmatota archaeon]
MHKKVISVEKLKQLVGIWDSHEHVEGVAKELGVLPGTVTSWASELRKRGVVLAKKIRKRRSTFDKFIESIS